MTDTKIEYEVSLESPRSHTLHVRCTFTSQPGALIEFSMPSWTPGSYLIRDYAQHVSKMRVAGSEVIKRNKDTWTCKATKTDVVIEYDVYAFDTSVRAAFFDEEYMFFTGTAVFVRIHGREQSRHGLSLRNSSVKGRVATAMPPLDIDASGFGNYICENYDELVDHPVMVSDYVLETFEVDGVPHDIAVFPKLDFDIKRLATDCRKLCKKHVDLFATPAPFKRYLFLLRAEENGYGGLEHRASTALICKISDLPVKHHVKMSEGYRGLLGLFSHEYFHAWNVKRLKPERFLNYDYNSENYTDLLWFFEGFTSYYDDLALVRSGAIDQKNYFELLARAISRVYAEQGRLHQSLADSSFDAWIKFYKPNENSPNANVSYYLKGSLVALDIDLHIRHATGHTKSLDDVMRILWQEYALKGKGLTERDVRETASHVAGKNLDDVFDACVRETKDLLLAEQLALVGIDLAWKGTSAAQDNLSYLGCVLKRESDACTVATVSLNSPAMKAGVCAGDVIIAIDNLHVQNASFEAHLSRYAPGTEIDIHLFRRGWLKKLTAVLKGAPKTKCTLKVNEKPTLEQAAALKAWLHS